MRLPPCLRSYVEVLVDPKSCATGEVEVPVEVKLHCCYDKPDVAASQPLNDEDCRVRVDVYTASRRVRATARPSRCVLGAVRRVIVSLKGRGERLDK